MLKTLIAKLNECFAPGGKLLSHRGSKKI